MITKEAQVTTPDKSKELVRKGVTGNSMFEWIVQIDQYGKLNVLDDYTGNGYRAYTVAELINLLPPMKTITFLIFCFRTRLKPDAVADYVMNKL